MTTVASARADWTEGHRRFLTVEHQGSAAVQLQLEVLADELRRRVGQTFTLSQLTRAYDASDVWAREAIAERAPSAGWVRTLATLTDEAFYRYSRGAVDYEP